MVISAISALSLSTINNEQKTQVDKKAAPKAIQPQMPESNSGNALRSYFMGGQAVSFGFNCSTGKFVTKQIADVPCCCCGGRMILQKDLDKVSASFANKRGEALADKINKDRDYFKNNQGAIAGMIAIEAAKNPEMDAQEAVYSIAGDFKGKLQSYCTGVLNSTSELAKSQLGDNNPVSDLIEVEKQKVASGRIDRVKFTDKLVRMEQSGKIDPLSFELIINSAMELPQNDELARKEFTRIQNQDNHSIFDELLRESTQTIEHVHPHSKGGPNDTDNYLAECGECNHKRGNMSYLKWIKIHPEYPVNAQKHIEWFQQQIVDGKIDNRYDDYGSKIKETLSNESNGRMELKVLDKQTIRELRERAQSGERINVSEEIKKQEEENKKYEEQ